MKRGVILLILLVFFLGVSHASGDVEDILQKAREKYLEFRATATDIIISRTITKEGGVIIEEKIYKKGEMFRVEMDEGDITVIRIYDGESFWTVIPERGIRRRLPLEAKRDALLCKWFDVFGEKLLKVDRAERLGGRDCYVLAGRDNLFLWVDRKTLALLKLEAEGDEEKKVTITFSDFRTIEGWEIPLSAKMRKNGRTFGSSSIKLDIKTVLPMELFDPEEIEIEDPPPQPLLQLPEIVD